MINTLQQVAGGAVIAGAAALLTNPFFGEQPFLKVINLEYEDDTIYFEREIPGPITVADWRVTVVAKERDAPYCQTIPGPEIHQGWSLYQPNPHAVADMPLDVWVGDPGCSERLEPGDYLMIITWTPRDGRQPVVHQTTIRKE